MAGGFKSFLDQVGGFFHKVFTDVLDVAKVGEPIVDIMFPAVANLYNFTVQQASMAEAAANGVSGSGPTKLKAVVAAVLPYASAALKADGVPEPTEEQITNYVNAVVASMNALPAPVTTPSATTQA